MKNKIFLEKNIIEYEKNLMIKLSAQERNKLLSEIIFIVEKFEMYHDLDLENIQPTHFPITVNHQLRKDKVHLSNNKENIIKTSNNYREGFIGIKNDN